MSTSSIPVNESNASSFFFEYFCLLRSIIGRKLGKTFVDTLETN